jgi:hypothetical protein
VSIDRLLTNTDAIHHALMGEIVEALKAKLTCPVYLIAEPRGSDVPKPYVVVGRGNYHVTPTKAAPGQADVLIAHHMNGLTDSGQISETQACLRSLSTATIQQIVLTDTKHYNDTLRMDTFGVHHVGVPVSPKPAPVE